MSTSPVADLDAPRLPPGAPRAPFPGERRGLGPPGPNQLRRLDDMRSLRYRLSAPNRPPRVRTGRRLRLWLASWVRAHALSLVLVSALLVIAAVVLGTGVQHYPAFSDDEGTYAAQAWSVLAHGSLAHYTYWYDHPPLGWLQLAGVSWLLGPLLHSGSAVSDARSLMLIPALASAGLLFVLARRLGLRRAFATVAVLLFVLSPLAVASLRVVYLDNIATPWILGAFVLAASPERRLWSYAASGACLAIAVLTKETSLLFLPGLIVAVRQGVDPRTRAFCVSAFSTLLALALIAYPLYAILKGELLPGAGHVSLLDAARFQLYGRASTGSAIVPGSLSGQLVSSWLATDPWLLAAGILALPAGLWIRRLRPVAAALLTLVLVGLRPGYLPQPYVIALLPFCALLAAGVLDAAAGRAGVHTLRRRAVLAAALGSALAFGPGWLAADSFARHSDQTRPALTAMRWAQRHIDHRARVLVDDTFYVDLVRAGFAQRFGAVWFFKLDFTTNLDPSIVRHLPQGWRAFDYVISSRVIRSALEQNPTRLAQVRLALANSATVATFGTGQDRVEVRRIVGIGTGSGFLPRGQATPSRRAAAHRANATTARHAAARHPRRRRAHGAQRRGRHRFTDVVRRR
jgi:4-amino-4-deoxy-L-arabinose transferase-like glycosyltransferase